VADEADRSRTRNAQYVQSGAQEGPGVKITEKEVRYVAELANLNLSEAEVHKFQADLDEILGHVERLNEIDTTGVEPMAQVLYAAGDTAGDTASCATTANVRRWARTPRWRMRRSRAPDISKCRRSSNAELWTFRSLTIGQVRDGLLARRFSAVELTRETLRFAEAQNPATNAYLRFSPERALSAAARVDEKIARGDDPGRWPECPWR
jgi:aspartyl/glutamyl-tRNA(Asn/Gln) amidotransferase C subunit